MTRKLKSGVVTYERKLIQYLRYIAVLLPRKTKHTERIHTTRNLLSFLILQAGTLLFTTAIFVHGKSARLSKKQLTFRDISCFLTSQHNIIPQKTRIIYKFFVTRRNLKVTKLGHSQFNSSKISHL
jgi:hypothetical protein